MQEFNQSSNSPTANVKVKDSLFRFIFDNEEHKDWCLSLYNAINGTDYDDPSVLQFVTLKEVIYMNIKNDLSFILYDKVNFYEHQSTYNPNMPIRFLDYVASFYSGWFSVHEEINVYSSKLQKLPTPKIICFYNGLKDIPERLELRLSDAFDNPKESDIELTVHMININYGHNRELLEKCGPLNDYSYYVHLVRHGVREGLSFEAATEKAVLELPDDSTIKQYLIRNRAEVKKVFLTEYDEERTLAFLKKESYDDGVEDGKELGIDIASVEHVINLMDSMNMQADMAMDALKIPEDKRPAIKAEVEKRK